jgi:hypothetical protein
MADRVNIRRAVGDNREANSVFGHRFQKLHQWLTFLKFDMITCMKAPLYFVAAIIGGINSGKRCGEIGLRKSPVAGTKERSR